MTAEGTVNAFLALADQDGRLEACVRCVTLRLPLSACISLTTIMTQSTQHRSGSELG